MAATTKNRSYDVRRVIADFIGAPAHTDYSCELGVELADGRVATLLSTSNAGFRGIEGYFTDLETGAAFHASLGAVVAYEGVDSDRVEVR